MRLFALFFILTFPIQSLALSEKEKKIETDFIDFFNAAEKALIVTSESDKCDTNCWNLVFTTLPVKYYAVSNMLTPESKPKAARMVSDIQALVLLSNHPALSRPDNSAEIGRLRAEALTFYLSVRTPYTWFPPSHLLDIPKK